MRKGVCPVCDRPAEAHDFVGKKMSKKQELEHLTRELASSERDLEKARDLQAGLERWKADKERQEGRRDEITRLRRDFAKRKELSAAKASKTAEARRRLVELDGQLSRLKDVSTKMREADARLQDAEETLRKVREKLASARERLDLRREKQAEVGIEIVAKESAGVRRDALKEHELWLGDYFVPTLQMIEKSALGSINQEFGSLFQRWFGMLLSDLDKEVRVDEQFTPIVSQGGYEQEVSYLSGGERTSVALAYRLALNTLAQRVSAAMKSNLLILDEPTDGFSKEQLGNVREVLDDVGCPQMIIVSHDRELESFADQIFRVKKSVGESAVEPGGT